MTVKRAQYGEKRWKTVKNVKKWREKNGQQGQKRSKTINNSQNRSINVIWCDFEKETEVLKLHIRLGYKQYIRKTKKEKDSMASLQAPTAL